jgi:uncharacterized protein YpuA (DUF1002 family)
VRSSFTFCSEKLDIPTGKAYNGPRDRRSSIAQVRICPTEQHPGKTKGGHTAMDIQKIIADVVARLASNTDLIKSFLTNPVQLLEKTFGIDLPDDQINQIIEGVRSKIDLSNIDLSNIDLGKLDVKAATGLLGKLKGILGK